MTRYSQGGTKILAKPTTIVPGGMAAPGRTRFDQLMGKSRAVWADDPTLDLPCQRPDENPDDWFEAGTSAENRAAREHARQLCLGCPMREPCYEQAKANREGWGMWGGQLMEPGNRPGARLPKKRGAA
jgi:WhiB family redox-sensing transcriptional regulator